MIKGSTKTFFCFIFCLGSFITNAEISGSNNNIDSIDTLWVLIAAVLVFLMQAGFKALESGLVRPSHQDSVSVKNLLDFMVGGLAFFILGFGLMFGESETGFFGFTYFGLDDFNGHGDLEIDNWVFFLFQLCFVGTTLTIVSGALSGRIGIIPYLITSIIIGLIIYPLFGHWAWGDILHNGNEPWLASLGFIDFAGSTVVHSVGAWFAIVGIFMIGPRIGRFSKTGEVLPMKSTSFSYSILGTMLLWMGWWGFNGGSALALDKSVGPILVNTNLAAISGGLVSFFYSYFSRKKNFHIEKLIGGILTGLVAISACCHLVSPLSALLLGGIAGIVHNLGYNLLLSLKLDDTVGAFPIHGLGGLLGTLIGVPFFSKIELLTVGRFEQFQVQSIGAGAAMFLCVPTAFIIFFFLKQFVGLRISPVQEMEGSIWGRKVFSRVEEEKAKNTFKEIEVSHVSIKKKKRGYNLVSVKKFLKFPSDKRELLIKGNLLKFWNEEGKQVEEVQAMKAIFGIIESEKELAKEQHIKEKTKNEKVTASIVYASRIQSSILPSKAYLNKCLGDNFILNKPRDIVSGDFYWCSQKQDYVLFAVGDCTGHGVPGGFLTMLGMAFLNETMKDFNSFQTPSDILNELRTKVKHAISDKEKGIDNMGEVTLSTKDGMNIGLAVWDKKQSKIYYAGAYHPLLIIRKQEGQPEVIEIKGDRMPIGVYPREKGFTTKEVDLQEGDFCYLFSDGYVDQFGGEEDNKIMTSGFKKLLVQINHNELSSSEQKEYLEEFFVSWKKDKQQMDDMLVMGIKV